MRHALAAVEAPIFLRRPVVLISPSLEIGLGALRPERAPGGLEGGSRPGRKVAAVPDVHSPGSDPG
jgi:hypothetical protein